MGVPREMITGKNLWEDPMTRCMCCSGYNGAPPIAGVHRASKKKEYAMLNRIALMSLFMIAAIVLMLSITGCTSGESQSQEHANSVALGSANHQVADDEDSSDDHDDDSDDEEEIPLADVPDAI